MFRGTKLLRTVDLKLIQCEKTFTVSTMLSSDHDRRMLLIRVPREYDIVSALASSITASEAFSYS